jgi:hypothetical protein
LATWVGYDAIRYVVGLELRVKLGVVAGSPFGGAAARLALSGDLGLFALEMCAELGNLAVGPLATLVRAVKHVLEYASRVLWRVRAVRRLDVIGRYHLALTPAASNLYVRASASRSSRAWRAASSAATAMVRHVGSCDGPFVFAIPTNAS